MPAAAARRRLVEHHHAAAAHTRGLAQHGLGVAQVLQGVDLQHHVEGVVAEHAQPVFQVELQHVHAAPEAGVHLGVVPALEAELLEGPHAHTVELRLSYAMTDPVTGAPDPSAALRAYTDSRQAEATHCYVGRRWQDVLGVRPSPQAMMGHRLRMNSFLSKWLIYLDSQGHEQRTLHAFDRQAQDSMTDA